MKWSGLLILSALFAVGAAESGEQSLYPRVTGCEPRYVQAGEVAVAVGENLGKRIVETVYLTSGPDDLEVQVVSQKDNEIRFKIPAEVKAQKYTLMILTGGQDPKFVEQPVKVFVETDEERKARQEHEAEMAKEMEQQQAPIPAPAAPQN
jgi:hypothetical protein